MTSNSISVNPTPTLMAVRAHPDDECFVCGGTLARYSDEGARTVVVTCTLGECGEIVDPTMNEDEVRPRLGEMRRKELEESCRILGVSDLEVLGYRDSGMAGTPDNDNPASFNKAELAEAGDAVVALVRRYRPQVLITDDENGGYGHPDHIMANRVSVYAFEHAGDPSHRPDLGPTWQPQKVYYATLPNRLIVLLWTLMKERGLEMPWRNEEEGDSEPTWGAPDSAVTATIDVTGCLPEKMGSLRAHHTQIAPDNWWTTMPQDIQAQVFTAEYYQRAHSAIDAPVVETDLFAGLDEVDVPQTALP